MQNSETNHSKAHDPDTPSRNLYMPISVSIVCMHVCIYIHIYIYIHALGSRAPTPRPPYGIPPPLPAPGPPGRPCSQRSRTTGTNPRRTHANQREGGRWRMIPASASFTGAENRIRAGTGAPFARRKEQHHILYGNEHVTMTLLLTSGSNHTISL